MPTYEYACTACAERLEVVQSYTEDSLTECPSCAGRLRKVFSPVGIVFKGSGFYKNDSRGKRAGSDAKTDAKTDAKADLKSESKADGKSGSSSESKADGKKEPAPAGAGSSPASTPSAATPAAG